jgi:hypothetical protein
MVRFADHVLSTEKVQLPRFSNSSAALASAPSSEPLSVPINAREYYAVSASPAPTFSVQVERWRDRSNALGLALGPRGVRIFRSMGGATPLCSCVCFVHALVLHRLFKRVPAIARAAIVSPATAVLNPGRGPAPLICVAPLLLLLAALVVAATHEHACMHAFLLFCGAQSCVRCDKLHALALA